MLDREISLEDSFLIKATGFSMVPFIKDADMLMVKKVKPQDLKTGDIILYKNKIVGKNVCHRLVRKTISKDGFVLFARGDASGTLNEAVLENHLMGRVVSIMRNGKILNLNARRHIIFNWIIAKFYGLLRAVVVFLKKILIRK